MPFRILSLSGGGVRGIFQATFLRRLEQQIGAPLKQAFDLIAGTSTGSIVGMSIALGIPLESVTDFYKSKASAVFKARRFGRVRPGSLYPQSVLRQYLNEVMGDKSIREAHPIIVAASGLDRFEHRVFSNLRELGTNDLDLKVVDVVLASAAAPTFFAPVQPAGEERSYVDGGVWANSPSLLAVLVAHSLLSIPLDDICLLSIGTGYYPDGRTIEEMAELRQISVKSVRTILELIFGTQQSFGDHYAAALVRPNNLVRIDAPLKHPISLDDVDTALQIFPPLADTEAHKHASHIINLFRPSDEKTQGATNIRGHNVPPRALVSVMHKAGLLGAFPHRSISIREEYDLRVQKAEECIDILGFGLSSLREDHAGDFAEWKKRVPIRILLINPDAGGSPSYAEQRDLEEKNPKGTIKGQVKEFVSTIKDLLDRRFQVKLYSALPTLNIFRIDDDILWGPFIAGTQSRSTPTFIARKGGFLFPHLTSHFNTLWTDFSEEIPGSWLE